MKQHPCLPVLSRRNIAKFVVVDSIGGMPGWAQCLFNKQFNCLTSAGKKWLHMYLTYYNTPTINKVCGYG